MSNNNATRAISAENLSLGYDTTPICQNISFTVGSGEIMGVSGESGSGKTTLIKYLRGDHSVNCFAGQISLFKGQNNYVLSPKKQLREIGFISQQPRLVGRSNVVENVLSSILYKISLLRLITKTIEEDLYSNILNALDLVSMKKHALKRCDYLSGGQQQRVSIAKAIIKQPSLLLADEPIASLDPKNANKVFKILRKLASELSIPIVIILHQPNFLKRCDSHLTFLNGKSEQDPSTVIFKKHTKDED